MRFAVASRVHHAAMWTNWRARLRERGHDIVSTWVDHDGDSDAALWGRCVHDVMSADVLVLYAQRYDTPLRGALVEVGVALGCGIPVRVVAQSDVGDWAAHPNVTMYGSLADAFAED